MNDPVFLSFAFAYVFAALATIVATFGFTPPSVPVRVRRDRNDR